MKNVLFVCNHNAGRSQMAQAFFERLAPDDVRAESAGSSPARQVWPEVLEVMREVGIELAERKPKKLLAEMQLHADWAVTMGCDDACPYVPTTVEAWSIPDPAGRSLEEVRAIRDSIEAHVRELIDTKLDGDPLRPHSPPAPPRPAASRARRRIRVPPHPGRHPSLRRRHPRPLRRRAGSLLRQHPRAPPDARMPAQGNLRRAGGGVMDAPELFRSPQPGLATA